jgi:hypothetical protein
MFQLDTSDIWVVKKDDDRHAQKNSICCEAIFRDDQTGEME